MDCELVRFSQLWILMSKMFFETQHLKEYFYILGKTLTYFLSRVK